MKWYSYSNRIVFIEYEYEYRRRLSTSTKNRGLTPISNERNPNSATSKAKGEDSFKDNLLNNEINTLQTCIVEVGHGLEIERPRRSSIPRLAEPWNRRFWLL